jgi:enoyl-CoA hydratase/carnithine racemase
MTVEAADDYRSIRVAVDGPVRRITLDRPEVLNAIHTPMNHELQHALDRFADDPLQSICVLTGAGDRAFCVGADLKYAAARIAAGRRDELAYPPSGYAGLDLPSLAEAIARQENQPAYRAGMKSDDRREGPAAFAQKREPPWRRPTFHGKKPE